MADVSFYRLDGDLISTQSTMDNRAFAYGDGFFSTMGVHQGRILWLDRHHHRLEQSAAAFALNIDVQAIFIQLKQLANHIQEGMIKIIITRREQAVRGYGFVDGTADIWLKVMHTPLYQHVRFCHGFPVQPSGVAICLAAQIGTRAARFCGLKLISSHEHIFAHHELLMHQQQHPDITEGLVKNTHQHIICGTMSNVFYRLDGRWYTPPIDKSGVHGVLRQALLSHTNVDERLFSHDDLNHITNLFFTNAVRGIIPIHQLILMHTHRTLDASPLTLFD